MPRRGCPSGWFEVIRGSRPPSVMWLVCPSSEARFAERRCQQFRSREERSSVTGRRMEPCVAAADCNRRVRKLRRTRSDNVAQGHDEGTAGRAGTPIFNQGKECEEFIAKAEKRLVLHDWQRSELEVGRIRLLQLRAAAAIFHLCCGGFRLTSCWFYSYWC